MYNYINMQEIYWEDKVALKSKCFLRINLIPLCSGWLNDQQLKTVSEKPSIGQYSLKMLGFVKTCTLVFILQNYFQTTGSIKCYICNMMKQNTVQVSKKSKEVFIFLKYLKTYFMLISNLI